VAETLAVYLLTTLAIEATATAVAITTVGIGLGLSVGLGLLAQQFLAPQAPERTPNDRQVIVKSSVAPRTRSYGRVRIGGAQMFLNAKSGVLYRVLAHADGQIDGIEEHLIADEVVTLDGSGWVVTPAKWLGNYVRIQWRDGGTAPAHYTSLEAAFPDWDDTHLGKGIFHSLTSFRQNASENFSAAYPQAENTSYKVTIRAARVWDPRDLGQDPEDASTWVWSDNAALCILDHLRHASGMGVPLSLIEPEIDAWIAAADACDDAVPLAAGGTEARYRVGGTYSFDERPADVLSRLMTACNARLWNGPSGGIAIAVGVWTEPTVTIGDDAITGYELASGSEGPETANTLSAVYTDPSLGYVEADAEPWSNPDLVAAFGEKKADARLYMVPSHGQCRRLMKQALAKLAPAWKGQITTNLLAMPALAERFVRIQIAEVGLDITAEIDDVQFRVEAGSIVTGLVIQFTAMDATTFDWDAEAEEGTAPEAPPAIARTPIDAPTGVLVLIGERAGAPVGLVSWDAIGVDGVGVEVEYALSSTLEWQRLPASVAGVTSAETPALIDGETYSFRARAAGLTTVSPYTAIIERDATYDSVAPGVPITLSVSVLGTTATIAWTMPASANTYGARLYRGTTSVAADATLIGTVLGEADDVMSDDDTALAAGTYWWFVATINGSGIASARTLAGTDAIA
jgi:hypothetical protein